MMRVKFDVSSLIKSFIAMVLNQFGCKIKIFRSDNGSEFFNSICGEFLGCMGLFIRVLAPTPHRIMEWLKGGIDISLRQLELSSFKQVCLLDFGVVALRRLCTLSTEFL